MPKKSQHLSLKDWSAIKAEVTVGVLPIAEIARRFGLVDRTLRRRIEQEGWRRTHRPKLRELAERKLRARADDGPPMTTLGGGPLPHTTDRQAEEAETSSLPRGLLDAAAEVQVTVVREHRVMLARAKTVTDTLLTELEAGIATPPAEMEQMARQLGKTPRQVNLFLAAVALPGRASVLRDLAIAMKHLVALDRQAFGIDDRPGAVGPNVVFNLNFEGRRS